MRAGIARFPRHRGSDEAEPLLHGGPQTMPSIWILAAGAVALAAALIARRTRRKAADVSVQAVSEEWLSDLRGQGHEGL